MAGGRLGAARAGRDGPVAWVPTLLRGRPRRAIDLVRQPRSQRPREVWLVIVDASASTRRNQGLSLAKGVLAQAFDDAYRRRARLALLTASGQEPRWQYQGLKASRALQGWLAQLGAGGGTPLEAALQLGAQWLEHRRRRHPSEQQRLLLLTDGRLARLPTLPALNCAGVLIDLENGPIRLGRARALAEGLALDYCHVQALPTLPA
ncbi:VWA domain-containing protein [Pseudomonas sp. DTU_2021_1001937_2_SI_NGA_ILE_001]|uniref:vWA domain-containing protein n=1 Tax=Pseudomonas sp. DTU_2021_1001937_2_SI_NGA_ILE_001 TaxID=3077589 RepID=UPI0028FC0D60|nr:VWA domain-containing protein [Pseudomonas sp. DTU_2021_1001937_2_SI_NGA_ILE_001]WNW14221.1 VWA domain-containing protein [Pseudomonas sp. DTU_2021_1001937_2_SI_NGA_ILE_001]